MKLLAPALLEPGEDHVGSPAPFDDADSHVGPRNLAIGHIGAQRRLGQAGDLRKLSPCHVAQNCHLLLRADKLALVPKWGLNSVVVRALVVDMYVHY